MLLFRSGQHVDRWCRQWNRRRGRIFSLNQGWRLAQAWYTAIASALTGGPRPWMKPKAAFAEIGLRGPFWRLKR
jgi:hypothetical protein